MGRRRDERVCFSVIWLIIWLLIFEWRRLNALNVATRIFSFKVFQVFLNLGRGDLLDGLVCVVGVDLPERVFVVVGGLPYYQRFGGFFGLNRCFGISFLFHCQKLIVVWVIN